VPFFERDDLRVRYEIVGDGDPVLLIAPGGMRSAIDRWDAAAWNPLTALADRYRLIAMDQRNAGESTAPVDASDGWSTYTADQIALLDHLDVGVCHVVGMCIGGPYAFGLINTVPERIRSAVMLQPVGIDGDNSALRAMFDQWAEDLAPRHPEMSPSDWDRFGRNMWDGDFVLTVTRAEAAACTTPILVLMGDDEYHPQATSREIAELASNANLVERWKDPDLHDETDASIKEFLASHPV
jgi:pimeloyl-ACP methyl ester carboxylesterase